MDRKHFHNLLRKFRFSSKIVATLTSEAEVGGYRIPVFVNEFWTSQQRQANSIH
jgi:hypothetical protein